MSVHRATRAPVLSRARRNRMLLFCWTAVLLHALVLPVADTHVVRYLLAITLLSTAIVLGMLLGTDTDSED